MQDNIKIGDYARTKPEGFLGRIINIKDEYDGTWYYMDNGYAKRRESIKCSSNIRDLIEEGDVIEVETDVKYYEVIGKHSNGKYLEVVGDSFVTIEDIKGIITKERLEELKFEVHHKEKWRQK